MELDDIRTSPTQTNVVQFHVAEAVETLRQTQGPFDLIFNDIDKEGYPEFICR